MAKRCSTKNPCRYPRADWWQKSMGTDWYNRGTSTPVVVPNYSIYPSTDRAIKAGTGTGGGIKGYYAFGSICSLANGNEGYAWRKGSDHNAAADGDIIFWIKPAGSFTLSAEYTVKADIASYSLTNVNCAVGNNNRVFVFWTRLRAPIAGEPTGPGDVFYKYSDDVYNLTDPSAATWSSELQLTTDFGENVTPALTTYIDGPGEMIKLADGTLLKPVWTTAGSSSSVRVYKSTAASNGLVWTSQGLVTNDSVNPCDETCLVQISDGTIIAFIRCNTLNFIRIATSTNSGATWSALQTTNIPSQGKSPVAVSPQGIVAGITRDISTGFTRYFWSKTPTVASSFTTALSDGRQKAYMYGGIYWSITELKFIAGHGVEAEGSSGFAGPTLVIRKEFAQSTSAVAAPTVYDISYQCMIDFANANGETLPGATVLTADNTFIAGVRSNSVISPFDVIYIFMSNDAATEAFHKRNWLKPWETISVTASASYGVQGYDFNGTTQYITGFTTLNQLTNYKQNTAQVIYYTSEDVDGNPSFGCGNGAFSTRTDHTFLNPRFSGSAFFSINGGVAQSVANASSIGLWFLKKLSSTATELWKGTDGSTISRIANPSVSSTGLPTSAIYVGAEKYSATVNNFTTRNCGALMLGSHGSGNETIINTLWYARKTAIGA